MKKILIMAIGLVFIVSAGCTQESKCWQKARSIQVGMIKTDIEKICIQDGGIGQVSGETTLPQRYFIRDCHCDGRRVIKLDVEFKKGSGVVTKVSPPYCESIATD